MYMSELERINGELLDNSYAIVGYAITLPDTVTNFVDSDLFKEFIIDTATKIAELKLKRNKLYDEYNETYQKFLESLNENV